MHTTENMKDKKAAKKLIKEQKQLLVYTEGKYAKKMMKNN